MDNWNEYGLPSSLQVKRDPQYGRGVYATTLLQRGEKVLEADPYVHVLNNDLRGHFCDWCLKESEQTLPRCKKCQHFYYCNKTCQEKDWWKYHMKECKGIAKLKPLAKEGQDCIPGMLKRLAIRALQRKNKEKKESKTLPEGAKWEVDLLCSYNGSDPEVKKDLEVGAHFVHEFRNLSKKRRRSSVSRVSNILHKLYCNTFSICRADLDNCGVGVYILPSLFNHSCLPNCIAVFEGHTLKIRTIEDIRPGEQLFISYVDLLNDREERQHMLKEKCNFECQCMRCETEMKPDSQYWTMYATVGYVSEKEKNDAVKTGKKLVEELEGRKDSQDVAGVARYAEESLKKLSVLHPMHSVNVKTLQYLKTYYVCMANETYEYRHKALKTCEKLTEAYKCYLQPYHPFNGIHLLRQAQIRRMCRQPFLEDARKAVDVLKVAYGEDHHATKEAKLLMNSRN